MIRSKVIYYYYYNRHYWYYHYYYFYYYHYYYCCYHCYRMTFTSFAGMYCVVSGIGRKVMRRCVAMITLLSVPLFCILHHYFVVLLLFVYPLLLLLLPRMTLSMIVLARVVVAMPDIVSFIRMLSLFSLLFVCLFVRVVFLFLSCCSLFVCCLVFFSTKGEYKSGRHNISDWGH